MTGILILIGLLILLLVLPLAPLVGAVFAAARIFTSHKPLTSGSNLLLLLLLVLCLLPYAFVYGRQFYRNSLCNSEGLSDVSFVAEAWAHQYPEEAAAIGPAQAKGRRQVEPGKYVEPLNSRFTLVGRYRDRGFSVTEVHQQIVDLASTKVVAEVRYFHLPMGSGKALISFNNIRSTCNIDSRYWKLQDSLRRMGHRN